MIHDHAATIALIRAGGFVDQGPLLALCDHIEHLEAEAAVLAEYRRQRAEAGRKGGLKRSPAKTKANRLNGRKAVKSQEKQEYTLPNEVLCDDCGTEMYRGEYEGLVSYSCDDCGWSFEPDGQVAAAASSKEAE